MHGCALASAGCSAPSAASACGPSWSCCPRCRRSSASIAPTASLPYTLTMIGFAVGGVVMGRMADRFGIMLPALIGAVALSLGYVAAAYATSLWQFALAHGLLIALLGGAASFGPIVADISHWFTRRRGIAVAIAASGNYLAGTIWPPLVQHFVQTIGWRQTHLGIGVVCAVTMIPLALAAAPQAAGAAGDDAVCHLRAQASLGLSPATLQIVLSVAGFCCCVAMSMPQVHIVAYCGDLGYGVTRGAEMLSLMLGLGIVSRVGSGFVADRIGGLPTLLLGSVGQMLALLLYLGFSGLASLYADLRAVRPGAGRHRAKLRDRDPRIPAGARGRHAVRRGDHGDAVRHGVRRLDLGRDLRCHRFVSARHSPTARCGTCSTPVLLWLC